MPLRKILERRRAHWIGPRTILGSGLGLAVLLLAAYAGLAAYELDARVESDLRRVELLAQMAQDQCAALMEAASATLDVLADQAAADLRDGRVDGTDVLIPRRGFATSAIAGVALLDEQGRRLAGAARVEGARAMLSRDIAGAAHRYRLVAALDAEAFVQRLQRVAAGGEDAAALVDASGTVLAATASAGLAAGRTITLPATGDAQVGPGLRAGTQIVAARALPRQPLFVVFEQARAHSVSAWAEAMRRIGVAVAGVVALVLLATLLALRISRSREAVSGELDAALVELAQRGSELTALVGSVQELIFRTDPEGRVSFVNARWHAATGRPGAEAMGRPLAHLVAARCREQAQALFSGSRPGSVSQAQLAIATAQGTERHFNTAVVPMFHDGRLVGFAGSAVDVTEQVRAEQRLKAQLAYSALLVEVNPLPTSLVDAGGRILEVNQAWEALRGLRKADMVGVTLDQLLGPDQAERARAQNASVLASGEPLRYETELVVGDGSTRDMVLTKVPVNDPEHGPAVLTVAMDVSEFREAERSTRLARDLAEEASRAKSEFVANISHELRTPLQSILGYSELGIARSREHLRLNAMFSDVHEAGKRMLALVNDLLDVSKIESAVGTFHLERGDVRPWVRDVVHELQPLLANKALHTRVDLGALPLVAKADPLRLQQVVRNVLANAIKFSPRDTSIDVEGGLVTGGEIELSVRDRGPGIPEPELEKIFDAFVQSSQTKDGSGGTGLGLAISRKIVEGHGGRIWAENAREGGSRFRIRLPAARGFVDTMPAAAL